MAKSIFPEPIANLPEADIPIDGLKAFLSQSSDHQILFMEFEKDTELKEHRHESQVGFVLSGRIEITIGDQTHDYRKGDIYYIPKDVPHSGRIYAGYSDITFFNQRDRYGSKQF